MSEAANSTKAVKEPSEVASAAPTPRPPHTAAERVRTLLYAWPRAFQRQWPLCLVLIALAVGFVLIFLHHWRRGAVVLGGAVGLAGFLRLILPEDRAGLLVVRAKWFDVVVTGLTGAAIMILAMVVPPSN